MTYIRTAIVSIVALSLFGCASHLPSAAEMQAADYGPKPTATEKIVREQLKRELFDPYSAVIESLSAPVESCHTGTRINGSPRTFGWQVVAEVNAKNRLGAYTGIQRYSFLIRNGTVVSVHRPGDIVNTR